jgi:glutamate-5-semialdehyde dehydrogenase
MKYAGYFERAVQAAREIIKIEESCIGNMLVALAGSIESDHGSILEENRKDLERMDPSDPKYDRLKLTPERIRDIATDLRKVASLPSPLGQVMEERMLKNGLALKKVRVPLGVIGIIYESRPNVTFDVFSLCLKSGNVCLLKGGSDAEFSNSAICKVITGVLEEFRIPSQVIQLLPASHDATSELLNATGFVDVIIPRGGQQLIDYVRKNSRVPVIETGAGIVHTYFDQSGNADKGERIIENAKLRRVSVCNALDCLIIHSSRLNELPRLVGALGRESVEIFADDASFESLKGHYPPDCLKKAGKEHFGTEFLSKKMAIKTVNDRDEALDHIARYGSKHSEAIIAEDENAIGQFFREVDAAAVYANTSTAFTDGAQFELGAEIGISTQKLHARGPMALEEMTSYKWIIRGDGQIRTP